MHASMQFLHVFTELVDFSKHKTCYTTAGIPHKEKDRACLIGHLISSLHMGLNILYRRSSSRSCDPLR